MFEICIYRINQCGGTSYNGLIVTICGVILEEFTLHLLVNAVGFNSFFGQIAKAMILKLDVGLALVINKCIECDALEKNKYWRVYIHYNTVKKISLGSLSQR